MLKQSPDQNHLLQIFRVKISSSNQGSHRYTKISVKIDGWHRYQEVGIRKGSGNKPIHKDCAIYFSIAVIIIQLYRLDIYSRNPRNLEYTLRQKCR